jgi:3-phenylpropionate/trans-cinnamate dioxygenase ferredoxin reductase subunit
MALSRSDHVIVVGAGLAGWRTCEELRRHGFEGRLSLIGDEPYAPYDRPPLSKQVMSGKWTVEQSTLATPERLERARVRMRLGVAGVHLDVAASTVHLSDASAVVGTHVVIATGARARRLPLHSDVLYEVRSRDDAQRVTKRLEQLSPGDVVGVIGAGFIGAEVATALSSRGLRPIILEASPLALDKVLGVRVAGWLSDLASNVGIELRTGQRIAAVEAVGVQGDADVVFDDATRLSARAVVIGVGAQPNVEWLVDSGIALSNGVVVDANQLCAPNVGAVGDVASFLWPGGREHVRIEHWQVATDHAGALARHWMTGEDSPRLIPYFWSDQYGKKIQMLGHPSAHDDVVRVRDTGEGQWLALYSHDDVVTGLLALSQPRALMLSKPLLERETSLDEALVLAPWASRASA